MNNKRCKFSKSATVLDKDLSCYLNNHYLLKYVHTKNTRLIARSMNAVISRPWTSIGWKQDKLLELCGRLRCKKTGNKQFNCLWERTYHNKSTNGQSLMVYTILRPRSMLNPMNQQRRTKNKRETLLEKISFAFDSFHSRKRYHYHRWKHEINRRPRTNERQTSENKISHIKPNTRRQVRICGQDSIYTIPKEPETLEDITLAGNNHWSRVIIWFSR